MRQIIRIDEDNLNSYYYREDGNLYYCDQYSWEFEVLDGFSFDECLTAILDGMKFIWIEGGQL